MKIDPGDKSHATPSPPIRTPKSGGASSTAFADILKSSIQAESAQRAAPPMPARPIAPTLMASAPQQEIFQTTENMLDAMEHYQQLLADPKADLTHVDAAVRVLKAELSKLEPMVEKIPEGNAIKQIAQETMMTAAKEIARFDDGRYV